MSDHSIKQDETKGQSSAAPSLEVELATFREQLLGEIERLLRDERSKLTFLRIEERVEDAVGPLRVVGEVAAKERRELENRVADLEAEVLRLRLSSHNAPSITASRSPSIEGEPAPYLIAA